MSYMYFVKRGENEMLNGLKKVFSSVAFNRVLFTLLFNAEN